jgi:hypothetical protein
MLDQTNSSSRMLRHCRLPVVVALSLAACRPPAAVPTATNPILCSGATWDSLDLADAVFDLRTDTSARELFRTSTLASARPHLPPGPLRSPQRVEYTISYVIDTSGAVIPGSRAILESTNSRWNESICESLATQRFVPFIRDGKPIRVKEISGARIEAIAEPANHTPLSP